MPTSTREGECAGQEAALGVQVIGPLEGKWMAGCMQLVIVGAPKCLLTG